MIKQQRSIIFDLGAVMVDWNPKLIAKSFTNNLDLQQSILQNLFHNKIWLDFDNGLISETLLIKYANQQINLTVAQLNNLIQKAKESLHAKQDMVNLLTLAKEHQLNTYCLSNLSHEWFAYLNQRHDFFKLFDGKVISAQEGVSKPNIEIYKRMLKRYQINSAQSLFIDDRSENTAAAETLGINCITFKHSKANLEAIKQFIL